MIILDLEPLKKDPVNKIIFKCFNDAYLVGGCVRDFILKRESVDRDFIIIGKVDTDKLKYLAKRFNGKLIHIKNLIRIILQNGKEVDITFTEDSIIEDLKKRDFTINTMAWSYRNGLLDPFNGIKDLKSRLIRAVSIDNLRRDPLRIMRAYRLAGELQFKIDLLTRNYIKKLKNNIKNVSKERVTKEFFKILNLPSPNRIIKMAIDDRIIEIILNLDKKKLSKNYALYVRLNKFIKRAKYDLTQEISQSLNYMGLLRLAVISRGFNSDRSLLRLSRNIIKRLNNINRVFKGINLESEISKEELFDYFMEMKDHPEDLGFIMGSKRIIKEAERFLKTIENPVIRGDELSFISGLKGKSLGELYRHLLRQQFIGR